MWSSCGFHVLYLFWWLTRDPISMSLRVERLQSVGVVSALSAYREWRCGELYMRKIYILTMIKWYNIWNQATILNVCVLVICIPALFGYPD